MYVPFLRAYFSAPKDLFVYFVMTAFDAELIRAVDMRTARLHALVHIHMCFILFWLATMLEIEKSIKSLAIVISNIPSSLSLLVDPTNM